MFDRRVNHDDDVRLFIIPMGDKGVLDSLQVVLDTGKRQGILVLRPGVLDADEERFLFRRLGMARRGHMLEMTIEMEDREMKGGEETVCRRRRSSGLYTPGGRCGPNTRR